MTLHQLTYAFGVCVLASALAASVRWVLHWIFSDRCDDPAEPPEMDLCLIIEDAPRFVQHVTPEMVAVCEWN